MKKILFLCLLIIFTALSYIKPVVVLAADTVPPQQLQVPTSQVAVGDWIPDSDVTFVGKTAARASQFLTWILQDYSWASTNQAGQNALSGFWVRIRNLVYAMLLIVVLGAAFVIIVSGGRSLTALLFARKFIIMVVLITFSYTLMKLLYQFTDIFTGFFVKNPDGTTIGAKDLLNISFDYASFTGFRRFGPAYDESAFVSLLLIRLTAIIYYIMATILVVRKVILWFFIAVSPVYPLILLYFPVKNTAKVWIAEFFRWLLYGPLFYLFLSSLVALWKSNIDILDFTARVGANDKYETAINILLGGPGKTLSITNSLNDVNSFAQYIVALIMLCLVIFLPFILLQMFLDYLTKLSFDRDSTANSFNNVIKNLPGGGLLFPKGPNAPAVGPSPVGFTPGGIARAIPAAGVQTPTTKERGVPISTHTIDTSKFSSSSSTVNQINRGSNIGQTTYQSGSQSSQITANRIIQGGVSTNTSTQSVSQVPRVATTNTSQNITSAASNASIVRNTTAANIAQNTTVKNTTSNTVQGVSAAQITHMVNQQNQSSQSVSQVQQKGGWLQSFTAVKPNFTSSVMQHATQSMVNFPVPTMRDIVRYETAKMSSSSTTSSQVQTQTGGGVAATVQSPVLAQLLAASTNTMEALKKISQPQTITSSEEREQFAMIQKKLIEQKTKGDPLAASIISAASSVTDTATVQEKTLPKENTVQIVSLDDYEAVKRMWEENYQNMDIPVAPDAPEKSRPEWVKGETDKTAEAITLLTSSDPQNVTKGMDLVADVLPFLLIGGFSQTEVVAYLKAKQEAGKSVLKDLENKEKEKDTLLDADKKEEKAEAKKETAAEIETPAAGDKHEDTKTS